MLQLSTRLVYFVLLINYQSIPFVFETTEVASYPGYFRS